MATAFRQVKNGAMSTIAAGSGIIGSSVSTSLSVASGEGAKFPSPGNGFWATIWNSTSFTDPRKDPNAEVVLVTARSTDAFTVTRGQLGTSANAGHAVADAIQLLLEDQQILDIHTAVNNLETGTTKPTGAMTQLGFNRNSGGTLGVIWADYATITATSSGGTVYSDVTAVVANGNSGGERTFDMRVLCDGATITPSAITALYSKLVAGATTPWTYSFNFSSTPSAASHTWKLQLQASAASAVVLTDNFIRVVEVT